MSQPTSRPRVLVFGRYNADGVEALRERFDVVTAENRDLAALSEAERAAIQAVAVAGHLPNELIDALPALEIVGHFGVGYDGVDAAYAAGRGVAVTNTPDVLSDEVADTAVALLLMTVRDLARAEAHARSGAWEREGAFALTRFTLRGRTVGIMGLGRIGLAITRRLEPFGVAIRYHNRSRRGDVAYPYDATLVDLARESDVLLIAAPGGPETEGAVNGEVLRALGPEGILVNIGRGTVVDEPALIEALRAQTLGAAGLDVFADEPRIPEALRELPNTVLLPHVASASRDTRRRMGDLVRDNLFSWFEGRDLPTPVSESADAGLTRRPDRR